MEAIDNKALPIGCYFGVEHLYRVIMKSRSKLDYQSRAIKVAIVHDWLTAPGGAERVLKQMLLAYPQADLYTICDFLPEEHRSLLSGRVPKTSFIQRLPFARRNHKHFLPLMPLAIEHFDLSKYDLILSSSYCVAKGVLTGPNQTHVSYIHTPIRYAWHLQHQYLEEMHLTHGLSGLFTRSLLHYLRMWDLRSAVGVDSFIANSSYVARQVTRLYKHDCVVLHPPVELDRFRMEPNKENYYVTASRLVPYKRVDLIVKAFTQMPDRRLIVIGDGPEMRRIRAAAAGHANIEILGYQPDGVLAHYISKARAFLFAAIEDFGIAPIEAQACGTPVIALGHGGALETIVPLESERPTGVYFYEQTCDSIVDAVEEFEAECFRIEPINCRENAERFSTDRFMVQLKRLVSKAMSEQEAAAEPWKANVVRLGPVGVARN
jgi:glycosyltransferase involved in cell wall biosynthesis